MMLLYMSSTVSVMFIFSILLSVSFAYAVQLAFKKFHKVFCFGLVILCACMVISIGLWSLPMSSRTVLLHLSEISAHTMVRSGLLVVPEALCKSVGSDSEFCFRIMFVVLHISSISLPPVL